MSTLEVEVKENKEYTPKERAPRDDRSQMADASNLDVKFSIARAGHTRNKTYFRRVKSCPFSGPKALDIDYKDLRIILRFVSPVGRIMPRRHTGVCHKKQRELAQAIERARFLALIAYSGQVPL